MLTILLLLITWYATKVYYTKDYMIHLPVKDETSGLIQCTSCAQYIYTKKENFRSPFYCVACG